MLLVLLASESLKIVSASRAYVGGESLWSKAQKEAVYSLFRYAQSHAEADYAAYLAEIAVPMGDHRARLELERPDPDLAVAREGFLAGKNDPDDVDGMIMLFRRFRDVSFMHRAIAIWAEADEHIAELNDAAAELHARISAGETRPEALGPILVHIDDVNRRLTPLEEAFSNTLGEASRRTQTILEVALVLTAMLLVLLGAAMSRRMLRASENLEAQLFAERDRAQVTLRSIAEGVIATDLDGRVETLNTAAQTLTGWRGDEAIGRAPRRRVSDPRGRGRAGRHRHRPDGDAAARGGDGRAGAATRSSCGVTAPPSTSTRPPPRSAIATARSSARCSCSMTSPTTAASRRSCRIRRVTTRSPAFPTVASSSIASRARCPMRRRSTGVTRCSSSTSTGSRKSTTRRATRRATRCCAKSARCCSESFAEATRSRGWAETNSACCWKTARRRARCGSPKRFATAVADFRFEAQDRRFDLGVSIGLVPIADGRVLGRRRSSARADACCYRAKGSGRNRVYVYQSARDDVEQRRRG